MWKNFSFRTLRVRVLVELAEAAAGMAIALCRACIWSCEGDRSEVLWALLSHRLPQPGYCGWGATGP